MMELGVDPGLKSPYSSLGPEDCPVAEREFSWEQLENSIPKSPTPFLSPALPAPLGTPSGILPVSGERPGMLA